MELTPRSELAVELVKAMLIGGTVPTAGSVKLAFAMVDQILKEDEQPVVGEAKQ